jgi:hypothetical protein
MTNDNFKLCSSFTTSCLLTLVLAACGGQALDVGSNRSDDSMSLAGEGGFISIGGFGGAPDEAPVVGGGGGGPAPEPACPPCSRRPGANASLRCPRGADETETALLGVDGGELTLIGQQGDASGVTFRLQVPPGALSGGVTVRLTESSAAPPADFIDYSPVYVLEPTDLELVSAAKLTVPFGNGDGTYSGLAVYVAPTEAGPFEPLADSYMNAGFMQATTTRFGAFVVASPRTPGQSTCP